MTDTLDDARERLRAASESANDDEAQEQLRSIAEGIDALTGDEPPRTDRIEELTEKLAALEEDTEGSTRSRIESARSDLAEYRTEDGA